MNLTLEQINDAIQKLTSEERAHVTDGFHTFDDLYQHRCAIFAALCNLHKGAWKSKKHSDGSSYEGWFICGINRIAGNQISYHLPMNQWMAVRAVELEQAPEFDGHTSDDVIVRLLNL